jgi:hypothetical protein
MCETMHKARSAPLRILHKRISRRAFCETNTAALATRLLPGVAFGFGTDRAATPSGDSGLPTLDESGTDWLDCGLLAHSERNLLAGFLVGMPLVYVSRYLFASTGRMANYWFWVEVLGTIIFVALAVLGLKRSPWFLAVGIAAHGLAWDTWHYRNSTYIPDWYATACLAVDLAFGAYVAARVPAYQSASRIKMS